MKNIEINIKQSDGTYEVLYPKINAVSSNISTEVGQQFGLENGSIDDVLKYLGKFNEYWWSEESNTESWEWDLQYSNYKKSNQRNIYPIYYSKKINIANDASITLDSEQSTYDLNVFKESLPCYVRMQLEYNGASQYTNEYFWVTEETCVGFYEGTYEDDNEPYVGYTMTAPLIQHIIAYKKQIPKTITWKSDTNSNAYSKKFYDINYTAESASITSINWDYNEYYYYTSNYTFSEYGKVIPGEFEGKFSPGNDSGYLTEIQNILPGKYVFKLNSSSDLTWNNEQFYFFEGTAFSVFNSSNSKTWTVSALSSVGSKIYRIQPTTTHMTKTGNLNLYWSSPYLNLKQMVHSYIGSYIGTGLYGYDNPTVLEFDFVPKLIICNTLYWSSNGWQYSFIWTINNGVETRASGGNGSVTVFHNGTKISFISTNDGNAQFNALNTTYNYVAFG